MRTFLVVLLASALVSSFAADLPFSKATLSGKLNISSMGGALMTPSQIIYYKEVKVQTDDMYLECEKLTLDIRTNSAVRSANLSAGMTNLDAQIERIIAETNLLMMARGTTLLGDRAVYTSSNETVVITGELVVVEQTNRLFCSTNIVYNMATASAYAVGWNETILDIERQGAGTNTSRTGFGPMLKPAAPAPPKNNGAK